MSIGHPNKKNRCETRPYLNQESMCIWEPRNLKKGILLEQLENLILVVELGNVNGSLPIQVLKRAAVRWGQSKATLMVPNLGKERDS